MTDCEGKTTVAGGVAEARGGDLRLENDKLRQLVNGLRYCANKPHSGCIMESFSERPTKWCCPLYDASSGTTRCETLMLELGIEAEERA